MSANTPKSGINWEAVWKELDWDDPTRQQDAVLERLRQRAKQYAAPLTEDKNLGDTHTLLTFRLGTEAYGVDVGVVQSVRSVSKITRVPGIPHFYRGVVNVRGQIISVLDLRRFFEIAVDDRALPGELVVVRANRLEIGILAHHVEGVMRVPQAAIEPLEDVRYALGVTMQRLVVLDIVSLLEDDRLIIGGGEE